MSDEADNPVSDEPQERLAGELLADARRARKISFEEISRQLHLDEGMVRALEQNEFDKLGAPVFAKGYLRKYAELVGVPADQVLADYYKLNRTASAPPLVSSRLRPGRDLTPGLWLGLLAGVLVLATGGWWWFSSGPPEPAERGEAARDAAPARDSARPQPETAIVDAEVDTEVDTETDTPAAETRQATDQPAAGEAPEAVPAETPVGRAPEVADAPAPATVTETTSPAPPPGQVELRLAYSGDCWTEVTDASGARLYFGLGAEGRVVNVSGEAPLNVLLGDSNNVALEVNGESFPVPRSARRGDTARLTITAR